MKVFHVVSILIFSISIATCAQSNKETDLDNAEFKELIKDTTVVILDVRTPGEYSRGHLAEAKLVDIYNPSFQAQISSLDPEKTYAIYCRTGNRSSNAVRYMKSIGFKRVFHLQHGISRWDGTVVKN